jgi:prepilin-type N-terminal cleavage/methylation domain-containing protein
VRKRGFTVLELMVVVIIIGVLATLGMINFASVRERVLDREAQANLRLIRAAERIYRMELSFYYPSGGSSTSVSDINTNLRLQLTTSNWNYKIDNAAISTFTAKAQRVTDTAKVWCIKQSGNEADQSCTW